MEPVRTVPINPSSRRARSNGNCAMEPVRTVPINPSSQSPGVGVYSVSKAALEAMAHTSWRGGAGPRRAVCGDRRRARGRAPRPGRRACVRGSAPAQTPPARPPQKRDTKVFGPQARVYLDRLGVTLTGKDAKAFFEARGMKRRFACQDRSCCRTWENTIEDPRRHFVHTRAGEVAAISRVPSHDRPAACLEWIRNASDDAVYAARFDPKKFEKDKRRLHGWRMTLTDVAATREFAVSVRSPEGGRFQNRGDAPVMQLLRASVVVAASRSCRVLPAAIELLPLHGDV